MGEWKVVKFRKLRQISGLTSISRQDFINEIDEDPINAPEQMKLF